jgi:hypothetical protein
MPLPVLYFFVSDKGMKKPKFSKPTPVRLSPEDCEILEEIEKAHKIPPASFIRGMVTAGCAFYREHGYFYFPVEVVPQGTELKRRKADVAAARRIVKKANEKA